MAAAPFHLQPLGGSGLGWLAFERHLDPRGWLCEAYNLQTVGALGLPQFGQDNISMTRVAGVVRGLHFQRPPDAQAKLFRVSQGRAFNVCVDLRPADFGRVDVRTLSDEDAGWIHIPPGFAHGFQTLVDGVMVHYKLDCGLVQDALGTVNFADPALAIEWPVPPRVDLLSLRDSAAGPLAAARGLFS